MKIKCKRCGTVREIGLIERILNPHLFDKWFFMKCNTCGKRSWLKKEHVDETD